MKIWLKTLLFILLGLIVILFLNYYGILVLDRSAKRKGTYIYWKDKVYVETCGEYNEGKTVAKASDGSDINEVKDDDSHIFIVRRSFLDQYLYVREDYDIPESGKITAVYWWYNKITDPEFCKVISEIYTYRLNTFKGNTFEYETEGIYMLTKTQHMRSVCICYENCPVGTSYIGYMGKVNNKWVITTYISSDTENEDGSLKPYTVICKEIPDKYIPVLEKYLD